LKWQWQSRRAGLPRPPRDETPTQLPDVALLQANAKLGVDMQPTVTWIGHATVLAQFNGLNVLTDPVFSAHAGLFSAFGPRRMQPPGLSLNDLPPIDLVLISHNHYDHLDSASVDALNAQETGPPLFIVPLGLKSWLLRRRITNVAELDWWEEYRAGSTDIVLTPAQHWSGRGLGDRNTTLWTGFAVFTRTFHLFYSGDTGYSKDFKDIRQYFAERQGTEGFDLALLPIGAYEPRWFMADQHVNPDEAVRIHRDLGAKRSLGIHWGTFALSDESLDEPPRALAEARQRHGVGAEEFFVVAVGQTRVLSRRHSANPARNARSGASEMQRG
jgi:N-acyl-phosphatidylethanolamine-hydrolysing phospholipase D